MTRIKDNPISLLTATKKVALVHYMAILESKYGEIDFTAEELWRAYNKGWKEHEFKIELKPEEIEIILDELRRWSFISKSIEEPFYYALNFTKLPDKSRISIPYISSVEQGQGEDGG